MITIAQVQKALDLKQKETDQQDQEISKHIVNRCEVALSEGTLKVFGLPNNEKAIDLAVKYFNKLGFKVKKELKTYGHKSRKNRGYEIHKYTLYFSI